LLHNKAPSIPFTTTSIHISKKRLGCSEKKRERKKRRKERGKKIKERGQMSQRREILSSPSSSQNSSKIKRGVYFFKGAKVKLGIHHYHPFTHSFLHTSIIITICHYHHISTQTIYVGPHMHILI
jgi:nucleosome binding factor SPN SPT16 subunit